MTVSRILQSYLVMTPDAVAVGCRAYDEEIVRIVYVNPSYERLLGYSSEEVLDQPVTVTHDPEAGEAFVREVQSKIDAGIKKFQTETQCRCADGTVFQASVSFFVLEDPGAGKQYACATFRDISDLKARESAAASALAERDALLTEQARMNHQLLAAQDRLASALNAYPDPFVIYDKNKRLVTCNTAYQQSMSHDPSKIKPGMHLSDVMNVALDCELIPPPEGPRDAHFAKLYAEHSLKPVEDAELPGDRHFRMLRSRAENGDWMILRVDVTELVRERRQTMEMHKRMISAMNAYPDPFAIFDSESCLLMWNDAFVALVGAEPGQIRKGMTRRSILKLVMKRSRFGETYLAHLEKLVQSGETSAAASTSYSNLELPGDRHYRVLQSRAPNGDIVVIYQNSTALVREGRTTAETQARLLAAISAYPAPFCIYDADNRLVNWNERHALSFTDDPKRIHAGMHMEELLDIGLRRGQFPEAVGHEEAWREKYLELARECAPEQDVTLEGDIHHRLLRSRAANGDLVVVRLDTTQLVRQQRALQETQDRLISAISAFPDPFAIYDKDLRLVLWNPAFEFNLDERGNCVAVGMHATDVLRIALRARRIPAAIGHEEEWLRSFTERQKFPMSSEDIEFANDQHYRIVRSRSDRGESLVLRMNMTETIRQRRALETYAARLEEANQKITHEALHDQLTGTGNRRYLSERFEVFSRQRQQDGGEIAALHIDLDFFKQINDTIGHDAGDRVLTDVARRIRNHMEEQEVLARIGGDEFIVLMQVTEGSERPEELARQLISVMKQPLDFEGRQCRFGCSIGIAKTPLSGESELLTNSDVALYKAKRAGRGCLAIFDRTDIDDMRRTKLLADDIVRGISAREFIPYYQPQVDAETGEVIGIEALARWQHPEKGILPPDAFLDVASEMNVIADIDRAIFNRALEECTAAFEGFSAYPSLSFNVSAKRLEHEQISEITRLAAAYPGKVVFELLETIYLEEESNDFLMRLDELREVGIGIEVDDFGSGRTSIVALQRIGPDRLKIDRRLVAPMQAGNSAAQLVTSIVEIGHALNIGVIAEGVETAEQVDLLARLGAERLQGFYISPPIDLDNLLRFFRQRAKSPPTRESRIV